jgi:hypothetical protein
VNNWLPYALFGGAAALLFLSGGGPAQRQPQTDVDFAILEFGGKLIAVPSGTPSAGPQEVERFTKYLRDSGVRRVDPIQLAYPYERELDDMRELGYQHLVPPREWWPRAVLVGKVGDFLIEEIGPLSISNYYRPPDFNEEVGGTAGSKHLEASAADFDFTTENDKDRARALMGRIQDERPDWKLGLGTYSRSTKRLHVDILAPSRSRAASWP